MPNSITIPKELAEKLHHAMVSKYDAERDKPVADELLKLIEADDDLRMKYVDFIGYRAVDITNALSDVCEEGETRYPKLSAASDEQIYHVLEHARRKGWQFWTYDGEIDLEVLEEIFLEEIQCP